MFEKIVFKTLLDRAITAEEEAYKYYSQRAEQYGGSEAGKLLEFLAGEELIHRIKLEELKNDESLNNFHLKELQYDNIRFEPAETDIRPVSGDIESVLEYALNKEKTAFESYKGLEQSVNNSVAENLFRLLAEEEQKHVHLISNMLHHEKD